MSLQFFKKSWVLLFLIVLLAAVLRFYQLGSNPPSLTWDEVAWGYNAYAIGTDGRDEFGKFLPYTSFVSFGDYKPPVYAYLTVVPVWLFGLTAFAVRFPSALFGTLTVLVTYFLVKELFVSENFEDSENRKIGRSEDRKNRSGFPVNLKFWHAELSEFSEYVALTAALIMALSPWHIMLSRAAFEANVASFFIACGVWLFLFALRRTPMLLALSVFCFAASVYTFNSTRVVAPILFALLVAGHIKSLVEIKKATIISFIFGVILLAPIAPFLLSPQARLRYQEVNIFSDLDVITTANQEIANDHDIWWSKIIHNRRVAYAQDFLEHYFDNLNPSFLFVKGDPNPKFSTQDVGQMYLWDLPFFVIGILFLFRQRRGNWWIIPVWLLVGIIPAAVARETPHALRTEVTLPTWQILTAYGFVTVVLAIKRYQKMIITGLLVILFLFVGYYLHGYYTYYPKEYSLEWQYGYKQVISYIADHQQKYDHIYISGMGRGYIYTLFYLKYPPQKFRDIAKVYDDGFGFVHVAEFDKYSFIDEPGDAKTDFHSLYIAESDKLPSNAVVLQKFYTLDGVTVLTAYKLKPPKVRVISTSL
ncbi:MAG TPA: phospholipid carrier-dependent glycosyltransferase [Candidatus Acidoferrales bacterium]|nr:phospholipid carrier-dependent glycosyltransferase [Candidatus Acidoferrales bacterium]